MFCSLTSLVISTPKHDEVLLLGGAAVTWPLAVRAQQPTMPVVGFLRQTRVDTGERVSSGAASIASRGERVSSIGHL